MYIYIAENLKTLLKSIKKKKNHFLLLKKQITVFFSIMVYYRILNIVPCAI